MNASDVEVDYRRLREWKGDRATEDRPNRWKVDVHKAVQQLRQELASMGVGSVLIETDHPPHEYGTATGRPRAVANATTSRVQVWFEYAGTPVCMPAWAFRDWRQNIKAVAMTLERQRLVRDYGVVKIRDQVASFTALPPASGSSNGFDPSSATVEEAAELLLTWAGLPTRDELLVLNVAKDPDELRRVYRLAAEAVHPDKMGDDVTMTAVNQAKALIEQYQA